MPTASMYRVRSVCEPWGDYANILISGLVERDETSGLLLMERTVPFVPPISVAVCIVRWLSPTHFGTNWQDLA